MNNISRNPLPFLGAQENAANLMAQQIWRYRNAVIACSAVAFSGASDGGINDKGH
jgi:hypothetical protein